MFPIVNTLIKNQLFSVVMFSSQFRHLRRKKNTFRWLNNKPKISDILTYKEAPYKRLQKTEGKNKKSCAEKVNKTWFTWSSFMPLKCKFKFQWHPLFRSQMELTPKSVYKTLPRFHRKLKTHTSQSSARCFGTPKVVTDGVKELFSLFFSAVHP